MYNQQQGSSFGVSSSFSGMNAGSQNRGQQNAYKPVGMVKSQYDLKQQSMGMGQTQSQSQSFGSSFHTANYRGNQAGHDNWLRADSQQPSSFRASSASAFGGASSQAGTSQSSFGTNAYQNVNSFHTANYRGNQAGHDNYLRSDSQNATSSSQSGFGSTAFSQSQFQPQSQFQSQSQFQGQAQMQSQHQSPQSFHTANYRGNQAGHDNSLRADSQQPTSSFGGISGSYRA